jgi:hypothetical protein
MAENMGRCKCFIWHFIVWNKTEIFKAEVFWVVTRDDLEDLDLKHHHIESLKTRKTELFSFTNKCKHSILGNHKNTAFLWSKPIWIQK